MSSLVAIKECYNSNPDFKDYVDKYCIKHRTTAEKAIKCAIVQEKYKHIKELT